MKGLKALRGMRIVASDGMVGVLNDVHFDWKWRVRYLAVESGLRKAGERLLAPAASASFAEQGVITVGLRRRQFGSSTGAGSAAHLLSGREMARYRIEASDGPAGELDDLVVGTDWSIAAVVVTTGNWVLPGFGVTLAPLSIARVDRARRRIDVSLTRSEILRLPRTR